MRLLPKSLFGRLTLVLITGLGATVLLSAGVHMHDRGRVLYAAIHGDVIERTVDAVQLLNALAPAERRRLVPLLNSAQARVGLADVPLAVPPADAASAGAELVRRQLREQLGADVGLRVALVGYVMTTPMPGQALPETGEQASATHAMARRFIVQVQLHDGGWVWFERRIPQELFHWPLQLLLMLVILLAGVTALSLLAVRWIVRPLDRLREAADALGRDIHRPPLEETGPLEVVETARAFNTMQRRISRFVEDRARILAAVSHDLKTPLTRIRLRADLLEDEVLGAKIRRDLDDMQRMVDATLDFMRGTESREETRPLDLMALLESLCDDAAEAGQQVVLRGRVVTPYHGRPLALKRCIGNLLDNALRYGGSAEVSVRDSDKGVTLSVADQGPGIPEGAMGKVFEPFFRLEASRARRSGGTGLGLGIARNIARAHGGDLVLKHRPGGGLIAELRLPR
ncbi:MAG: HAMP domain-containing protein [Thiohalocapsa sp.]|uniref:ATP-binding protein n=1 Tax=Thiohalocapsa sp. TaxID=2497641 RepID=UPI0025D38011|nr:ATP-binding protein [Thiohalocapsa sp.]MCG6942201.1 HAMP domain-containing protein [Thiohalocapsa sp.]